MEKGTNVSGPTDPINQADVSLQAAIAQNAQDMMKGRVGEDINPLIHLSREQLMSDVEHFAFENALTNILPLLQKGALVAQAPADFEAITDLDRTERTALRDETEHRWKLPKTLYFTIAMNSIAGAIQGWDQTGSNGANLSFPAEFGIADTGDLCTVNGTCETNSWLIGFVNSAPYIAICIIVLFLNDPLNRLFGRRGTILIGAIFSLLAPIGSALCQTWGQLTICRILLGIGMGLKEVTVPRYSSEVAPTNVRGALTMSWQIWNSMGGAFGGAANLIFYNIGPLAWRYQLASAFIPAVPLLCGIYLCPESPRWYMRSGQYEKAYQSLCRIRNTPLQAARDLYYIHAQLIQEEILIHQGAGSTKKSGQLKQFFELWSVPRIRRGTQASSVLMIAQQMCGINIMAFYGATIFTQAGFDTLQALLISWGQSMFFAAFCLPSLWLIDTLGRRTLLLSTFPNMFWTILAAGLCFLIPTESPAHVGLVALFTFLFATQYSLGEGVCAFVYGAEVFPLSHSEMGMSWAIATNNFWASALGLTFPRMLLAMTPTGAFGFYAGLNIIALVFIFLVCPETSRLSLEELDSVFAISTRMHARYQCTEVIPWWFRRWIMRQKNLECLTLHEFEEQHRKEDN